MQILRTVTIAYAAALALAVPVVGQEHEHGKGDPEKLGQVHFENSCSAATRQPFDRAIAYLHSFWFSSAIDGFKGVLATDPSCGMAEWGIALSHWGNPFGGSRSPKQLQDGLAAAERAAAIGAKTARELDYIAAVRALYQDYQTADNRTRAVAYEKAMEQLHLKYPADKEAAAFYALALDGTALPTDKTYANQLKAAAILEKLYVEQPDHPGAAHYLIHTYDTPALADRAVTAARRYASIAPSVPHALHMPSHTFTRVGYWQESIDTNIKSAEAAGKEDALTEQLHALDYETYAYLQTAQDRAAARILAEIPAIGARLDPSKNLGSAPFFAGAFAMAAIPARYALERGAWAEAAALEPHPTSFPQNDAMTYFARAIGSARDGHPEGAAPNVEKLAALRDALTAAKENYWAGQVEIQRKVALAWQTFAEGRKDEALVLLRTAANDEDLTDKSAITPGPLAPARELLGEMLLVANDAASALKEFEASTKKEPNRFRGVYGAARAAVSTGDKVKARTYYAQLLKIAERADTPARPELVEASKFVGKTE